MSIFVVGAALLKHQTTGSIGKVTPSARRKQDNVPALFYPENPYFLGRHTGLRPTWKFSAFKKSSKSFNLVNPSILKIMIQTCALYFCLWLLAIFFYSSFILHNFYFIIYNSYFIL
jgi:hypothetical protein